MRSKLICVATFLLFSNAAFAQTPAPSTCAGGSHMGRGAGQASTQLIAARHAMKQACAADRATYCANVPRGCGAEKQCMKSHASQLSPSCASAMQNMRAARHGA